MRLPFFSWYHDSVWFRDATSRRFITSWVNVRTVVAAMDALTLRKMPTVQPG